MLGRRPDLEKPMSIPFHDVSIAAYTQILPGVCATLDKGKAFFGKAGIDPEKIPRILPGRGHEAVPFSGPFGGASLPGRHRGAAQRPFRAADARSSLQLGRFARSGCRRSGANLGHHVGGAGHLSRRDVLFAAGDRRRLFTAEEFVLSFSVPNLHFHAATVYDMLRLKGVPLGKRDYLGHLRGRNPDAG